MADRAAKHVKEGVDGLDVVECLRRISTRDLRRDRDNSNEKTSLRPEYGVSVRYDLGRAAVRTARGIIHCRYPVHAFTTPVNGLSIFGLR